MLIILKTPLQPRHNWLRYWWVCAHFSPSPVSCARFYFYCNEKLIPPNPIRPAPRPRLVRRKRREATFWAIKIILTDLFPCRPFLSLPRVSWNSRSRYARPGPKGHVPPPPRGHNFWHLSSGTGQHKPTLSYQILAAGCWWSSLHLYLLLPHLQLHWQGLEDAALQSIQ